MKRSTRFPHRHRWGKTPAGAAPVRAAPPPMSDSPPPPEHTSAARAPKNRPTTAPTGNAAPSVEAAPPAPDIEDTEDAKRRAADASTAELLAQAERFAWRHGLDSRWVLDHGLPRLIAQRAHENNLKADQAAKLALSRQNNSLIYGPPE